MTVLAAVGGTLVGLAATATLVGTTVFSFADDRIDESSGLVDLGATMVTTNDSGDDAVLYLIDAKGRTVGTTTYADEVTDVEALAPAGSGAVWVGDIGDNRERRTSVQVYRVPVGSGDRTVQAPRYDLVYPDGPHDAESLLVGKDGRIRVVSKGILGGRAYVAPKVLDPDRPNRLQRSAPVDIYATDAALFPDRRHVLVRGYGAALIATFPAFKPVAYVNLPGQDQGEGVSIGANGRIRLSSEGQNSDVLQVRLPPEIKALMKEGPSTAAPPVAPPESATGEKPGGDRPWLLIGSAAAVFVGWLVLGRRR